MNQDVSRTGRESSYTPEISDDADVARASRTAQWQTVSRPLMVRMLVGLSVFFLIVSAGDLVFLHRQVLEEHPVDLGQAFAPLERRPPATHKEVLDEARLRAVILLESNTIERHYHQASALVLSRLWKDYLGFVTGMILSLVGAAFVLGKLTVSQSELSAKGAAGELTLKTASPGLLLAVLGVVLMVTTLVTHTNIDVKNGSVYLRDEAAGTADVGEKPVPSAPVLPPPVDSKK
jgi:hypothetical protein